MPDPSESATLAYVRFVLQETKLAPTALAKEAGISATTLTRPLNNAGHKFALSTTTIEKIAKASGISPAPFFEHKDTASQYLATLYDKNVYNEDQWGDASTDDSDQKYISVLSTVAKGTWVERGMDLQINYSIPMNLSNYETRDCFAMIVGDHHVHPVAYRDDFLMCIRFSAEKKDQRWADFSPAPELAIVERQSPDGRLIELTALRLSEGKNGWNLTSVDLRPQNRIRHHLDELPGTDELRVIGLVRLVVRTVRFE